MGIAATILTITLSVMCVGSAVADFMMAPSVVAAVDRLGLPRQIIPLCGICKVCGALGLLIGFGNEPLQVFAAIALTAYFVCAVGAHVRRKDTLANTAPATMFLLVAAITLATTIATT
ncbi:MAG: DoxX family protein [Actinomycetota bacterium]